MPGGSEITAMGSVVLYYTMKIRQLCWLLRMICVVFCEQTKLNENAGMLCDRLTHWISCCNCVTWNTGISSTRQVDGRYSKLICCTLKDIFHSILCVCRKRSSRHDITPSPLKCEDSFIFTMWHYHTLTWYSLSLLYTCNCPLLVYKTPVICACLVLFQIVSNYFGPSSVARRAP